MWSAILAAIGSLILSYAGYAVQEATQLFTTGTKTKLTKIARSIYNKMSKNQKYLDSLYDAYVNKRSALQSLLMTGSGFGPRINAIYKELNQSKRSYENEKTQLTDKQAKLTNDYNEATNALAQVGTGIVPSIKARMKADEMEQYIKGGLSENVQVSQEQQNQTN